MRIREEGARFAQDRIEIGEVRVPVRLVPVQRLEVTPRIDNIFLEDTFDTLVKIRSRDPRRIGGDRRGGGEGRTGRRNVSRPDFDGSKIPLDPSTPFSFF